MKAVLLCLCLARRACLELAAADVSAANSYWHDAGVDAAAGADSYAYAAAYSFAAAAANADADVDVHAIAADRACACARAANVTSDAERCEPLRERPACADDREAERDRRPDPRLIGPEKKLRCKLSQAKPFVSVGVFCVMQLCFPWLGWTGPCRGLPCCWGVRCTEECSL